MAFIYTVKASAANPANPFISEFEPVLMASIEAFPPEVMLPVLERALESSPNSPNLNFHALLQDLRKGDLTSAEERYKILKSVGPDWEKTENARALIQYLRGSRNPLGR